jgi:membrane protein
VKIPPPAIQRLIDQVMAWPPVLKLLEIMAVYGTAGDGLLAAGLAFSSLFAILTGMLFIVGLSGFILTDPTVREKFVLSLTEAIPPLAPIISDGLVALSNSATAVSIIGLLGLGYSASSFYGALEGAFVRIFRRAPDRNPILKIVRGIIALAIVVAGITGGIVIGSLLPDMAAGLPKGPVGDLLRLATWAATVVLTVGPIFAAVVLMYRFVPNTHVPWRVLLPGAIAAGLVITVLTQGFVIIAPRLVGSLTVFGPVAAVFAVLIWLRYSFEALLLGACWTAMRMPTEPRAITA